VIVSDLVTWLQGDNILQTLLELSADEISPPPSDGARRLRRDLSAPQRLGAGGSGGPGAGRGAGGPMLDSGRGAAVLCILCGRTRLSGFCVSEERAAQPQ
jgi:hypothetical protein